MEVKKFAVTLLLVLIAIVFVPLIPHDASINCGADNECDDSVGYVSLYQKYVK
jgi:ABC-type cobalt transport system substrate-binding protein